jgi:hypothetical protein
MADLVNRMLNKQNLNLGYWSEIINIIKDITILTNSLFIFACLLRIVQMCSQKNKLEGM